VIEIDQREVADRGPRKCLRGPRADAAKSYDDNVRRTQLREPSVAIQARHATEATLQVGVGERPGVVRVHASGGANELRPASRVDASGTLRDLGLVARLQ